MLVLGNTMHVCLLLRPSPTTTPSLGCAAPSDTKQTAETHSQIQVPSSQVTTRSAHSSPSQAAAQPPRVHSLRPRRGPAGGVGAGGLDSEWTGAPACACPLPVQVKGESGSSRNPAGQNLRVQYLAPRCLPWDRGARTEACWSGHRGPNRAQRLVQTSLVPLKL